MIFFSDFEWHDLGFLGFLGRILERNEKNPRSWQEIQDYPRLSKILAKKPRRQAWGRMKKKIIFSTLQNISNQEMPGFHYTHFHRCTEDTMLSVVNNYRVNASLKSGCEMVVLDLLVLPYLKHCNG